MFFLSFKPMEPISSDHVPQGEFLYQFKWDGVRMLAHVGRNRVWLHNRKLKERTCHYPELVVLTDLVRGEAILDGEIVALRNGKPSFSLVLERDLINPGATENKTRRLMAQVPIFYMVFDLIWHNGQSLIGLPLTRRQSILAEALQENDTVRIVESFADGNALFEAVSQQKMEGIVAKLKEGHYAAGKRHRAWIKVKHRQKQLVAIGGYTVKAGQINALLAGAYHNGQFLYVGRVATGLTGRDLAALTPYLKEAEIAKPEFVNAIPGKDNRWVSPSLTALVDLQEWTEDLRMRQPVIIGFTKDLPKNCILGQGDR